MESLDSTTSSDGEGSVGGSVSAAAAGAAGAAAAGAAEAGSGRRHSMGSAPPLESQRSKLVKVNASLRAGASG